jgi:hypothetical protein
MIGFIAPYAFTQLGTAGNTALSLITVSLSHEVFFLRPNSFLAIILQLPAQFNSKLTSWQAGVSKIDSSLPSRLQFYTWSRLLYFFITPRNGPRRKHSLYY